MGREHCQEVFEEVGWEGDAVWCDVAKQAVGKNRRPAGEGAVQSWGGRQILGSHAKPGTYDGVLVATLCEEQFVLSPLFLGESGESPPAETKGRVCEPSQGQCIW